jgi:3-oxoacyl-[acyl-carrier-protein] synthase II
MSAALDGSIAVVGGLGLWTPLGRNVDETWRGLLEGRRIVDHAKSAVGAAKMCRAVAHEALGQSGWSSEDEFATVVGTSKGSVERWLAGQVDPAGLADIASSLGGAGPKLTISGACASGLLALIRGVILIHGGEARRVLVVAGEASVHPLFVGSFKRLGVLPGFGVGCRPFDERRGGFVMSEAAAAVCLEARDLRQGASGDRSRVAVDQFAMGGDATHLTGGDPEGKMLRYLLRYVCNHPVDLVHAHGTGTVANDPVELAAIESMFCEASGKPLLYSHKGAIGHSLGAAGLISVVINALAHERGMVPPNAGTTSPLPTRHVVVHREAVRRPIRRSVALASGFGGACAAVGLVTV